jgi:hypothetical protein
VLIRVAIAALNCDARGPSLPRPLLLALAPLPSIERKLELVLSVRMASTTSIVMSTLTC